MSFANNKDHINKKGRPKGAVDKDTRKIREAYQMLVEDNLENLSIWLKELGEQSPEKAFNIIVKMSEYFLPKLARQEVTGLEGKDLFETIQFKFGETHDTSEAVISYLNHMDKNEAVRVIDKALERLEE